jgi:hypothetical protein
MPISAENIGPAVAVGVISQRKYKQLSDISWPDFEWFDEDRVEFGEDGSVSVRGKTREESQGLAATLIEVARGDVRRVKSYDETTSDEDDPSWVTIIRRKE